MRDLLFADLDAEGATRVFGLGPRPSPLAAMAAAVSRHDVPAARVALADVLIRHPETRLWLQAWTLAREAGLPPSETAHRARGVVVEMGLESGVDTVACYDDGSARYVNQAGGEVFWDGHTADVAILSAVDTLLAAGQAIADATVPLDGRRPGPPGPGSASIAVLTEGGAHLGAGPADPFALDPLGGPAIDAALMLMIALIDVSQKGGSAPVA
ncbi:MAG TPA: hypothetical protein VF323_10600 [Candidatus Limnocylindrales bacterium]